MTGPSFSKSQSDKSITPFFAAGAFLPEYFWSQEDRKRLLEALREVDEVVIFDEADTKKVIANINPSVVVKGGEWVASEVRERDEIPPHIDVKICPLVENYSTTDIIREIHQKSNWGKHE